MKQIVTIFLIALVAVACTQNNGHIGPIFGAWSLTEMKVDDKPVAVAGEGTIFSFQDEVIQVTHLIGDHGDYTKYFGNFTIDGSTLTLKFAAGAGTDEGYQYTAPSWLLFPTDGAPIAFEIKKLEAKHLVIERTGADGQRYVYFFDKTW